MISVIFTQKYSFLYIIKVSACETFFFSVPLRVIYGRLSHYISS